MSLATLPPELYLAILRCIPPSDHQLSTLNLSRAIPRSPVPLQSLFEHITIFRQQQIPQLYRRLRHPTGPGNDVENELNRQESSWVISFTLRTWQVDPDVLINLLAILPRIERLSLMIGTVFSPEHLEDMFHASRPLLNTLTLRFRPYVQRATYYQFLKGSYFDSTLELLSLWPAYSALTQLSIVQDPLPPPSTEPGTPKFAQPIVFFSLASLAMLSRSPAMQRVSHLRLRIPSRQLVRFVAAPSSVGSINTPSFSGATYIDLSTCTVRESAELEALLIHLGNGCLEHVVLDETGLCNGSEGEWEALGRTCALAGVKRSREREKALKAWTTAEHAALTDGQDDAGGSDPVLAQGRRFRRGRRGLATATISLRDVPPRDVLPLLSLRPGLSSDKPSKPVKIRILPPPPCLKSLSTTLSHIVRHQPDLRRFDESGARIEFAKGWSEGLGQLRATWVRLRQSQSNGVRIVRFSEFHSKEGGEDMFADLIDVGRPDADEYWERLQAADPPVLCFAGPRGEKWEDGQVNDWSGHPHECGHRIAWDVWKDNL